MPYSLLLRDGTETPTPAQLSRRRASHRALRVLHRLAEDQPSAVVPFWDAVVATARVPGFYGLSRPRPPHPQLPGLPPVPEPASLPPAGGSTTGPLGHLVRTYIDRVVNRQDVTAVDDLVAPDYVGGGLGWPADRDALRRFYEHQLQVRPDWRIAVQSTLELGDHVTVHAHASGTEISEGASQRRELEWLTQYRIVDGRIREIRVLSVVPRDAASADQAGTGSQA